MATTKLETAHDMAMRLYRDGGQAAIVAAAAIRARDAQIIAVLLEEAKAWDAGVTGMPYTADHGIAITLRAVALRLGAGS